MNYARQIVGMLCSIAGLVLITFTVVGRDIFGTGFGFGLLLLGLVVLGVLE